MANLSRDPLVYGLADPRTGEVRYVGQTINGITRAKAHKYACQLTHDGNTHKANWVRSLLSAGLLFEVTILERVPDVKNLDAVECFWIAQGKGLGWPLTNFSKGGGGNSRGPLSEESKEKIRQAKLGTKHSAETRARMSSVRRGRKLSPEHCARISEGRLRRYRSAV